MASFHDLSRMASVLFTALFTLSASGADRLVIATEENPPFNMNVGGRVAGSAAEILKRALGEAGIDYTIGFYPWARAYNMALKSRNNCVFSTARIDQREARFRWVGPLAHNMWYILGRSDFRQEVSSVEDLRHYRVAALNGSAVALYLKDKGVDVAEITEDQLIVRMMAARRIDLWATTERAFYFSAEGEALALRKVMELKEVDLYLACNLDTDPALIEQLNSILARKAVSSTEDAASSKTYGQPATWTEPSSVR